MVEFVKLLNRCCHLFSTYVASHKIEKEEQEKKRWSLKAQNTLSLSSLCIVYWCFCFMECFKSGVLVPLDPHFLWQLLKLSDVSRCFYYEFWGERVGCFRLAIPLKVTTHPSWQHSFCVATLGFWASTVSSATPFLLTLWSDTPFAAASLGFLEYTYSISWLLAVLHGRPHIGISYWLWLPDGLLFPEVAWGAVERAVCMFMGFSVMIVNSTELQLALYLF